MGVLSRETVNELERNHSGEKRLEERGEGRRKIISAWASLLKGAYRRKIGQERREHLSEKRKEKTNLGEGRKGRERKKCFSNAT